MISSTPVKPGTIDAREDLVTVALLPVLLIDIAELPRLENDRFGFLWLTSDSLHLNNNENVSRNRRLNNV